MPRSTGWKLAAWMDKKNTAVKNMSRKNKLCPFECSDKYPKVGSF